VQTDFESHEVTLDMQSRFIAAFAGLAALAVTLATIAVSYNAAVPVSQMQLEAMPVVDIPMGAERMGPEFLSPNPQMQILTCFGHCGAECMVSPGVTSRDTVTATALAVTGARDGRGRKRIGEVHLVPAESTSIPCAKITAVHVTSNAPTSSIPVQQYCEENYAKCIQWEGASAGWLEPAPDYTNPTGRGSGNCQQSSLTCFFRVVKI
jgi:hypothetical protein